MKARVYWQTRYKYGQPVLVKRDGKWVAGRVTRAMRGENVVVAITENERVSIWACSRAKDIEPISATEICSRCFSRPKIDTTCGTPACVAEERRTLEAMRRQGIIK